MPSSVRKMLPPSSLTPFASRWMGHTGKQPFSPVCNGSPRARSTAHATPRRGPEIQFPGDICSIGHLSGLSRAGNSIPCSPCSSCRLFGPTCIELTPSRSPCSRLLQIRKTRKRSRSPDASYLVLGSLSCPHDQQHSTFGRAQRFAFAFFAFVDTLALLSCVDLAWVHPYIEPPPLVFNKPPWPMVSTDRTPHRRQLADQPPPCAALNGHRLSSLVGDRFAPLVDSLPPQTPFRPCRPGWSPPRPNLLEPWWVYALRAPPRMLR